MSSKKGKKNKGTTLSLQEFCGSTPIGDGSKTVVVPTKSSWAEIEEEDDDPTKVEKFQLPTAPRAARFADMDLEKVPTKPPFTAYVGNLPYEADTQDIHMFFKDLIVTSVRLPRDVGESGRLKGFGYAEFEDRDSLIKALGQDEMFLKGRKIKVSLGQDSDRRQQRPMDDMERSDRTVGDWRSGGGGGGGFSDSRGRDGGFGRSDRDDWTRGDDRGGSGRKGYGSSFRNDRYDDRGGGGGDRYDNRDRRDDDRYSSRDDRYSSRDDRYSSRDDRYSSRDDRYSSRDDRYRDDRYSSRNDDYRSSRDDRYSSSRDGGGRYSDRNDRYSGRNDRYSSRDDRYSSRDDRYSGRDDMYSSSRDDRYSRGGGGGGRYPSRDDDRGDSDRRWERRAQDSSEEKDEAPKTRKKLELKPRTVPVAPAASSEAKTDIFGGAKPVDTAAKEREIEERLNKVAISDEPKSQDRNYYSSSRKNADSSSNRPYRKDEKSKKSMNGENDQKAPNRRRDEDSAPIVTDSEGFQHRKKDERKAKPDQNKVDDEEVNWESANKFGLIEEVED